jgi:hypothetical protein
MTEAQLAQLHHELSKLERELVAITDQVLALIKERNTLRTELEKVTQERDLYAWRATSLGGDYV